MRFIVLRHGLSLGNIAGRIQGQTACEGLSAEGMAQARRLTLDSDAARGIVGIATSDAERACRTAALLGEGRAVPIHTTALLREVHPGVLAGLTRRAAAEAYPDALAIWDRRGDLDAIPGAEPGRALQARSLAFLAGWGFENEGVATPVMAVVSHAAFIRCLVNTAAGRRRETPVAVGHCITHTCDARRVAPAWLHKPWRRPAGRVATADGDFAVKMLPEDGAATDLPARIHAAMNPGCVQHVSPDFAPYRVAVRPWIEGRHRFGALGGTERGQLRRLLAAFHATLRATTTDDLAPLEDALERWSRFRTTLSADENALFDVSLATALDRGYRRRPSQAVDADVHRDNLVFAPEATYKIDIDALRRGCEDLQVACTLVGAYGLENDDAGAAEALVSLASAPLDAVLLRALMILRVLNGLAYFRAGPCAAHHAEAAPYLSKYRACLDRLTRREARF